LAFYHTEIDGLLAFDSSAGEALYEEEETALMAFVTALARTDEVASVMTQKTYLDVIGFIVEDDVRLLNLQLKLLSVLSFLPTHLDY
jgi:hypothetical protein